MRFKDKTSRRQFLASGLGAFLLPTIQKHSAVQNGVASLSPIRFRNVAESAGLHFVLENHPTPQKHLIESMAGGVAAFDYNNDGLTDIFFTNGASVPSLQKDSPKYFNRLFRNEGSMRFTDVTEDAGVAGSGYSMGAAAGDYDNDGHVDLFVAGVYRNILYRNLGNGRFEDITENSGIKSDKWSVAAGWFDYDNDGWLDLFVVNYAHWTPDFNRFCGDRERNLRVYCHPKYFEGLPNTLYRNRRDGTFEDVTAKSGIAAHIGRGMSVAFADYDQDGLMDVFVTNDNMPNFLFHNRGDGTFEEVALEAGVALTNNGLPVASMGADFRDYDNDGLPDLNFTALAGETFPLFRNLGKGAFQDATHRSRLGLFSVARSGWSNGFFDFNNDGWKDLFTANSDVNDLIDLFQPTHYRQPNSLFANLGNGAFQDVSAEAGFTIARAHRGSAFADFANEGKISVVVSALGEPAELWQNISPGENHWLILKLIGTRSNRDGIGAVVRMGEQTNHVTTAVGYASSSPQSVHFGIGKQEKIDRIEIRWPSGIVQVLRKVATNQVLEVHEPSK
ncbi:MAG TPA: CRTAC1 family protein [Candidatus Bathyarchaeia archaeon]|nr:CRTAC1 family protein [Candidatus Bathyarchaeia archaeon]